MTEHRQKYNAKITVVDNIRFASQAEAQRYTQLRLLAQSGHISDLQLQPTFTLLAAFTDNTGHHHRAITYRADFQYTENGLSIVEDVKGMETPVFKLKKKLFLKFYPQYTLRIVRMK